MEKYHFKNIDSTSNYLKRNYKKFDNLTFVSADYQEEGHGRYGRKWHSEEKKNLLFSVLIKDERLISKYESLSLASAVCVLNVLKTYCINNIKIKWPNDVYVEDKKIAGILLEGISCGGEMEALVLGVGLNVNSKDNMIDNSTSIFLQTNNEIEIDELKEKIYHSFILMIKEIFMEKSKYLQVIRDNNYLKEKRVECKINGNIELVEVIDINEDNSLKVKKGKEILNIYSGEVSFHG